MDFKKSDESLQAQNEHLLLEKDNLRSVLCLLKENMELKALLQNINSQQQSEYTGVKLSSHKHNNSDEQKFRKELHSTKSKHEIRTSSPNTFKSFIQTYTLKDAAMFADLLKCKNENSSSKAPQRLLGEIAYQLDRRILAHIFQAHERLYGFTVVGIPEKIIEVSTHPLTGKVDKAYKFHLTQHYADLLNKLGQFGYKPTLHPTFSEFVVNTFGILRERVGENTKFDYNDIDFLRKNIITFAPVKLQKDMLVLLDSLQCMSEMDKKPLLFW